MFQFNLVLMKLIMLFVYKQFLSEKNERKSKKLYLCTFVYYLLKYAKLFKYVFIYTKSFFRCIPCYLINRLHFFSHGAAYFQKKKKQMLKNPDSSNE